MEKIKISDLKPAPYNPRKISDDELLKLENSIKEFGFVSPIIVNLKNNHVIGGHQRLKVISEMTDELNIIKLGDVGLAFTNDDIEIKDEQHEKALNVALNKIKGKWDIDKLLSLMEELELSEVESDLTGFEQGELVELQLYNDIEYRNPEDDNHQSKEHEPKKFLCPHCNQEVEI